MSALATVFDAAREREDVQEPLRMLARQCGYLTYHAHRSDHSEAGMPDLLFVCERLELDRRPLVLFVECKREGPRGRLTPAQERWRRALEVLERVSGGVIAYRLARPSTRHEVEALLAGATGHDDERG